MSSPSFRSRLPFSLALILFASVGSASCGQQGIVAATSGTSADTGGGGSGGMGGAGAAGGTGASETGGGGSGGTGGAEVAMPLKVLNWNLHNMYDTQNDPAFEEDFALTKAQYDAKLAAVGAILKEMDPDIAVLPEVENKAILDELNTEQLGGAYTTAITVTNDFRGLDIGILTKLPVVDLVTHTEDSFKRLDLVGGKSYMYSRDAVELHVSHNGRKIVLLGVHYRSKGNGMAETDDKDKRVAEAQHTRAIADELAKADPKKAILILGDFNDLPGSTAVSWTLQGDPKNDPPIVYTALTDSVSQADRYTYVYNDMKELIDHQMANPLLASMIDTKAVVIRHGSDVEDASDHFPLMATYQIQ